METPPSETARALLIAVGGLDPETRDRIVEIRCAGNPALRAEVEALLAAADAGAPPPIAAGDPATVAATSLGFGDATISAAAGPTDFAAPPLRDGDVQIGPYRIRSELGRGGMGVVYLAERVSAGARQRYAVKVLERTDRAETMLARFDRERRILAALDHASIASLYEAGTTSDGRPYFVMEYIDGRPIDRYCDEEELGVEARLALFQEVCGAVQHAHNAQVVHRDLKPGNILVTKDGRPKLLDFGIARFTNPILAASEETLTIDGALAPMTPGYASPEQIRGDELIGAGSDVYSLGVILFELLSGHRPYRFRERVRAEFERVVLQSDLPRPSVMVGTTEILGEPDDPTSTTISPETVSRTRGRGPAQLRRRLEGDLDNIVLMALRKEVERRYVSAHAMAEDIERHLEGMPVKARPDTLGYRAQKFVRRHRVSVGTASAIAVILVASLVVTSRSLAVASVERDRAIATLDESVAVVRSMLVDLDAELRVAIGGARVRQRIAEVARSGIDRLRELPGADADPAVILETARALKILGDVAYSPRTDAVGSPEQAMAYYDEAIAWSHRIIGPERETDSARRLRAAIHRAVGQIHLTSAEGASSADAMAVRQAALDRAFECFTRAEGQLDEVAAATGPASIADRRLRLALLNDRARGHMLLAEISAGERASTERSTMERLQVESRAILLALADDPDLELVPAEAAGVARDLWFARSLAVNGMPSSREQADEAEAVLGAANELYEARPGSSRSVRDRIVALGQAGWLRLLAEAAQTPETRDVAAVSRAADHLASAVRSARNLYEVNGRLSRDAMQIAFTSQLAINRSQLLDAVGRGAVAEDSAVAMAAILPRLGADPVNPAVDQRDRFAWAVPMIEALILRRAASFGGSERISERTWLERRAAELDGVVWPPALRLRAGLTIRIAELVAASDGLSDGTAVLGQLRRSLEALGESDAVLAATARLRAAEVAIAPSDTVARTRARDLLSRLEARIDAAGGAVNADLVAAAADVRGRLDADADPAD